MVKGRKTRNKIVLPSVALKNMCMFPGATAALELDRESSVKACRVASENGSRIFVVAQLDSQQKEPSYDELFDIGTVCEVKEFITFPNGKIRVVVEGLYRARIDKVNIEQSEYFEFSVERLKSTGLRFSETEEYFVLKQSIKKELMEYIDRFHVFEGDGDFIFPEFNDGEAFSFGAAGLITASYEIKQVLLEIDDLSTRMLAILHTVRKEAERTDILESINKKVHDVFGEQQKEVYLREEMKVIREELGESDENEIEEYRRKLAGLKISDENRAKLEKDIHRLETMNSMMPDSQIIHSYLDYVFELPWGVMSEESEDVMNARKILDRDHYGLKKVKERILEYMAVRKRKTDGKDPIICLYGPPGVGKTSIARSLAEAMNKKYVRMSLGGVHDEADIRGHRKTYVGAMPGRIIDAIKQAGTENPLILLDELDKLGRDMRGDPASALLEVLDNEQNFSFRDHYLEMPFDVSKVTFITTANDLEEVPEALADRMEIIEISGYTEEEKLQIAKKHLVPKQLKVHGAKKSEIKISDAVIKQIVWNYTAESGVRQLERAIASVIRKSVLYMEEHKKKSVTVDGKLLKEFLGQSIRYEDENDRQDKIGVANGLAWTAVGGVTLQVEVNVFPGTGQLELTGSLGDVMKESAKAAKSYIRANAKKLGISETFYKDTDIHIHVPEGATPKDGPSAGITMATAMVSALSGRKIRHTVAMTGEITLRGNVLPIGGLKEKSLAALRKGMKTVLVPEANRRDEEELPESVKKKMRIVYVRTMDEVIKETIIR